MMMSSCTTWSGSGSSFILSYGTRSMSSKGLSSSMMAASGKLALESYVSHPVTL